ncbi:MAG TPA: hypothetical protein VHW24_21785, partial [Bryobacteraceae bacterium]|jgi:hypothetical protein|nr:hypothetical protein [Bryobacteraceae bacterium]
MAAMPQALVAARTPSLGDATVQVVVLAFDLVGGQAGNLPALLEKSLVDPSVQTAIRSGLDSFLLKRMTAGTSMNPLTPKDAQDLLGAMGSAAGGKLGDAALKQIKATPEYKKLEKAIADFQAAAKSAPLGVWIDSGVGIVFVTGIALAIGGAVALYATKTGGTVVNVAAGALKNKPFQIFKVGRFTLQGQMLAFQPDTQTLGAGVVATEKWKQLQVSLSLGVIASGTQAQQVSGQAVVKTDNVSVTFSATDTLAQKKIDLGLSVGFPNGPLSSLKFGLGAVVTDGTVTSTSQDASWKTKYGDFGVKLQESNKQFQGLGTWSVPLP